MDNDKRLAILENEITHLKERDNQLNKSIEGVEFTITKMHKIMYIILGSVIASLIGVVLGI